MRHYWHRPDPDGSPANGAVTNGHRHRLTSGSHDDRPAETAGLFHLTTTRWPYHGRKKSRAYGRFDRKIYRSDWGKKDVNMFFSSCLLAALGSLGRRCHCLFFKIKTLQRGLSLLEKHQLHSGSVCFNRSPQHRGILDLSAV